MNMSDSVKKREKKGRKEEVKEEEMKNKGGLREDGRKRKREEN